LEVLPRPFSFYFVWDPAPQHVRQENFCPQSMALSKCTHHLQPNLWLSPNGHITCNPIYGSLQMCTSLATQSQINSFWSLNHTLLWMYACKLYTMVACEWLGHFKLPKKKKKEKKP
jgi:hypothetical protein